MARWGGRSAAIAVVVSVCLQVFGLSVTTSAQAEESGRSFCGRTSVFDISRADAERIENRLWISNGPGAWKIGDCWWHTALQRHAFYLADFRPDEPFATRGTYEKAIDELSKGRSVVRIPGFRNLYEFSERFAEEFETVISEMHTRDVFLAGLVSLLRLPPDPRDKRANEQAAKRMREQLKAGRFPVVTFRGTNLVRGIHAYLVVGMRENRQGILFDVIDSNFPSGTFTLNWNAGNRTFEEREATGRLLGDPTLGVAVNRTSEYAIYERAFRAYCKP